MIRCTIEVGVALTRPPREDAVVRVVLTSDETIVAKAINDCKQTASLMAMARKNVVMPVSTRMVDIRDV
jgi:hypothetical protein